MEEAKYEDDPELRAKAMEVFDMAIERGWDKEYGGLLYFCLLYTSLLQSRPPPL